MSWGYKILIVYVAFIGMMLGMVYVASRQNNDMQDENYYAKELKYQQVIDGKNNLNALNERMNIKDTAGMIKIKIPRVAAVNITEAGIRFLCPSDKRKDVNMPLVIDKSFEQVIPNLSKGFYSVQLSWKSNNKRYYHEQTLIVH